MQFNSVINYPKIRQAVAPDLTLSVDCELDKSIQPSVNILTL